MGLSVVTGRPIEMGSLRVCKSASVASATTTATFAAAGLRTTNDVHCHDTKLSMVLLMFMLPDAAAPNDITTPLSKWYAAGRDNTQPVIYCWCYSVFVVGFSRAASAFFLHSGSRLELLGFLS